MSHTSFNFSSHQFCRNYESRPRLCSCGNKRVKRRAGAHTNNSECGRESILEKTRKMLEGKAIVSDSDMADEMKTHVLELAYHALDLHEVCDYQQIACFIKQKFDEAYGASWHCVVGDDFSCCITHLTGSFVFFRLEMTAFLVFKDGRDSAQSKQAVGALHPISQ